MPVTATFCVVAPVLASETVPAGLPKGADDPRRETDFCGVYRIGVDGGVTLLTRSMTRPNGLGFSPDEKKLYVAQSDPQAPLWKVFGVQADGTLDEGKTFFDAAMLLKTRRGVPDGMAVDPAGNLFATGPGGVLVFAPDGTHLGTLLTGRPRPTAPSARMAGPSSSPPIRCSVECGSRRLACSEPRGMVQVSPTVAAGFLPACNEPRGVMRVGPIVAAGFLPACNEKIARLTACHRAFPGWGVPLTGLSLR